MAAGRQLARGVQVPTGGVGTQPYADAMEPSQAGRPDERGVRRSAVTGTSGPTPRESGPVGGPVVATR